VAPQGDGGDVFLRIKPISPKRREAGATRFAAHWGCGGRVVHIPVPRMLFAVVREARRKSTSPPYSGNAEHPWNSPPLRVVKRPGRGELACERFARNTSHSLPSGEGVPEGRGWGLTQKNLTPRPPLRKAERGSLLAEDGFAIHPPFTWERGCLKGGVRCRWWNPQFLPAGQGGELACGRLVRNTSPYRWGLGKPCFPRAVVVAVAFPLSASERGCPKGGGEAALPNKPISPKRREAGVTRFPAFGGVGIGLFTSQSPACCSLLLAPYRCRSTVPGVAPVTRLSETTGVPLTITVSIPVGGLKGSR